MAIVVATGFLSAAGTASAGEFEWGIVFRDRRPVSLEAGDEEQTADVVLCNSSGRAASGLHWSLEGFHFTAGEKPVEEDAAVSLSETRPRLGPGGCDTVTITVAAKPEIDAGPFTGELVVTSDGGGVARLEVKVAGPAGPIVPTKGATETIELTATREWPWSSSPVSINGDSSLALKAPPSGKTLEVPEKGAFIGNLVNAGDLASVYVTGDPVKHEEEGVWLLPIEIRGAANTGVYEGVLSPTTSSSETQTVKAKMTITVWWPWVVLAVLLGAAIVVLPTVYLRRWRVEGELNDRQRSLVKRYAEAEASFHQKFAKFSDIKAPGEAAVKAYAGAIEAAVKTYGRSTLYFDTTSDAYLKLVKSLDIAEADAESLAGEGEEESLGAALTALQATLDGLATQLHKYLPIERQPTIALSAAAVLGARDLKVGEATIAVQKGKEFREGIATWTELAQTLRRCEVWSRALRKTITAEDAPPVPPGHFDELQEIGAAIAEARNELVEAGDAKAIAGLKLRKHLDRVYRRLAKLGAQYHVWVLSLPPDAGSADGWPQLKLKTASGVEDIPASVVQDMAVVQSRLPDVIDDAASWQENADILNVASAQPVELGRTRRLVGDVTVIVLSVATGTVASLSAFYFGKTFGTVEDFLTVIFLGTAAQAFLKPVTDTLAQLYGSTEPVTKSDPTVATATTVAAAAVTPASTG